MFKSKAKRYMALLVTLVLSVSLISGCGGPKGDSKGAGATGEKIELTFVNWAAGEAYTKDLNKVIAEYEKQNPNIKIKNVNVPVSDMRNQLMVMVMGGNVPDIAQVHVGDGVIMATMNALEPTENVLPQELIKDFRPEFYEPGKVGDKHYLIPWAPNTLTFYYNKTLLKELGFDPTKPPQTLDEMDQMMKVAKQKMPDVVGLQLDTTIRTVGLAQEWPFMNNFLEQPVTNDSAKVNSPEFIQFGEWIRGTVKNGYTLAGKKFGEFRPQASQNRLLFALDGPFLRGVVKSFDKNITDEQFFETWGVAPLPMGPTGKNFSAPDDHTLVVMKASQHKEEAAKFAEFLVNSEYTMKNYHGPLGFLPPTKSAAEKYPDLFNDPIRSVILEKIVPTLTPLPFGPNYAKLGTTLMTGVQEIITTDKPVKQILDNTQTQLEGVINGQ